MQNFEHLFPQDPDICYLNHAAVGPWPAATAERVSNFAKECVAVGAQHYPRWMEVEDNLRSKLAKLIGLENSHEISLAKSTSEALSIIAYGINWQEGDEVLISAHEFPSNRIVWESLDKLGVKTIEVDIGSNDCHNNDPVDAFRASITPKTKLISVSTIQYASGIKIDAIKLSSLCKDHDILLCLDAIQSLGAISFNQGDVDADFIVADGHKWMLGPEGLALMYIKESIRDQLSLHQYGWHMVQNRGNYDLHEWTPASDGTRFECGSPNMLGIHALDASLGVLHKVGMNTVENELQLRVDYLIEALNNIPKLTFLTPTKKIDRGGIITINIDGVDHQALYKTLMKQGVICAYRGGGIRFSPHFYSSQNTMDKAVDSLKQLI